MHASAGRRMGKRASPDPNGQTGDTRVNKIRYCPECMTQSRHIRSRWRLTVFDVCTIHHIRLKDDLVEPVMTRGYRQENRYFVTEVTDEQFWAGAVCPMPSERRHVDRLWSGFERSIVENDTPGAFEQLTCILFLEALLDALRRVSRYLSPQSCSQRLFKCGVRGHRDD
ncbi:hypothetical protein GNZ12_06320 [Paraburkholderia sp. 1N]|uniref:TniQ domain-containing protein n=1 Tax=Paraburkholderia solitsugae TaxID=2675748 RepID=A0ABX2BJ21_9BURK|nr:hypothetical protein [Paraburkholderia solitsugae]